MKLFSAFWPAISPAACALPIAGLRVEGEVALVAVAAVQGVAEASVDAGIERAGLRLLPEVWLQVLHVILVCLIGEAGAVLLLGGDGVAARRQAARGGAAVDRLQPLVERELIAGRRRKLRSIDAGSPPMPSAPA